jgi:hypothetical protein
VTWTRAFSATVTSIFAIACRARKSAQGILSLGRRKFLPAHHEPRPERTILRAVSPCSTSRIMNSFRSTGQEAHARSVRRPSPDRHLQCRTVRRRLANPRSKLMPVTPREPRAARSAIGPGSGWRGGTELFQRPVSRSHFRRGCFAERLPFMDGYIGAKRGVFDFVRTHLGATNVFRGIGSSVNGTSSRGGGPGKGEHTPSGVDQDRVSFRTSFNRPC